MGGGRGGKGAPPLAIGDLQARAADARRRRREAEADERLVVSQRSALRRIGPEEMAYVAQVRVAPRVPNGLVSRLGHLLKEVGLTSRACQDPVSREVFKNVVGTETLDTRAAAAGMCRWKFAKSPTTERGCVSCATP